MVWHYTKGIHIARLMETGYIRTTLAGYDDGERPAVWASVNQVWEQTTAPSALEPSGTTSVAGRTAVIRRWVLDMAEAAMRVGGLYRIALDPAVVPYTWSQYRVLSGLPKEQLEGLEVAGREHRARPEEWRAGFDPVPKDKWWFIEVWDAATDHWRAYA